LATLIKLNLSEEVSIELIGEVSAVEELYNGGVCCSKSSKNSELESII
jgi:hypothetical protein